MECYRCHVTMRKTVKDDVLVDRCPDCGGYWLDAGELEMMKEGDGLEKAELLQAARHELLRDAQRVAHVVGMCPKCERSRLQQVKKQGIELDVCGQCGGMFFDGGELDRMLEEKPQSFFSALVVLVRG